ncbi:CLUMA_CG012757, isoform A [Clunio marinus]|uniref:CLUMA_CG012757, isoform A n=1 Tax=Clunio marinus TaxID=568069 RepID=A0A1J1III3_9DIPT|nr:CLUMA_CG012757, isoform A [Clunio marinus]
MKLRNQMALLTRLRDNPSLRFVCWDVNKRIFNEVRVSDILLIFSDKIIMEQYKELKWFGINN